MSLEILLRHSRSLNVIRNCTVASSIGLCKFLLVFHCVYLLPFLRYSTSNNGVPLKSALGVIHCH